MTCSKNIKKWYIKKLNLKKLEKTKILIKKELKENVYLVRR